MTDKSKKLVITADELPDLPLPGAVAQASVGGGPAAGLPSVAGVKPAPMAVGGFNGLGGLASLSTIQSSVLAGFVAAILAWPLSEILFTSMDSASPTATTAVWVGVFGLVFGAAFCSWDDVVAGIRSRIGSSAGIGALVGCVTGAIAGVIAQEIYTSMLESALANVTTEQQFNDALSSPELYAARGIAFAVFGLGIGLAVGMAARSQKKAINGMVGGLIGGAVGGLVFQFLAVNEIVSSGWLLRLLSMVCLGTVIGLAIGLVEIARRQAWLQVASGGMAGKEFIVYHEVTEIGSSPKCQITLIKDPAIAAQHCRIIDQNNTRILEAFTGAVTVVNGAPITRQQLRSGDLISLGGTSIQYSEKATAA